MPETRPWVSIDETVHEPMARVVGAKPVEVCVMNTLTANIHFLMVPFYRPTKDRFKIVMESKAFPSDHVREASTQLLPRRRCGVSHTWLRSLPVRHHVAAAVSWHRPGGWVD